MIDSRLIKLMPIVAERYNAPGRHYHNWNHIVELFRLIHWHSLELNISQYLAILFHDIVYVPGSTENEANSVNEMRWIAAGMFTGKELNDAAIIILDTKTHVPTSFDSRMVLDLDMAILGNSKTHAEYDMAIRKEFSAYPDHEYYTGRKMFCEATLALPNIYWTMIFNNAYDAIAREYLKNSIRFCKAMLHEA
jgi:predicted metal-dependent HD superfamily phosphohydrolase